MLSVASCWRTLTNAVITRTGRNHIRTATPSSHSLIRAFAAKCNWIVVTGYGFAWSRKRLKIKNVVSINAARNQAACVLHIRDVHKMRHRVRVARALLFFMARSSVDDVFMSPSGHTT